MGIFSSAEKELRVLMGSKPNMSQESAIAASHILGCISKSTASRSRKVIISLYLSLVRPQLEHCALVWSPQFQRNIEKLERIQRVVMKTMRGLKNLK